MSNHTRIFGSALPVGSDDMGDWPDDAGYFSDDFSERFTLDHYMDGVLVGSDPSQDGRHRKVTMKEISSPTAKENCGIVFTKEADSLTEFHYLDDLISGNEKRITKDGLLNPGVYLGQLIKEYAEINLISGTLPVLSYNSNGQTELDYPSSDYNSSNCMLIASKFEATTLSYQYHTNNSYSIRYSAGFTSYNSKAQVFFGETFFNSNIGIYYSPVYSGGKYKILIGRLR